MTVVEKITLKELHEMAQRMYGTLVKGVVDLSIRKLILDIVTKKVTDD